MRIFTWVGVLALIAVLVWANYRMGSRKRGRRRWATNSLEELLEDAVGFEQTPPALRQAIMASKLLAFQTEGAPENPMTFSIIAPAKLAAEARGMTTEETGEVERGPYLYCFSSDSVVKCLSWDPLLRVILVSGSVGEFGARHLFQVAIEKGADLVLNPFHGVTKTFSPGELQSMLQEHDRTAP
jgi:hypothetical protein